METLSIFKEDVYTEIAQTTSYTGAKMDEETSAYDRIFTTDEDRGQLERFWRESCVAVCEAMARWLRNDDVIENTTGDVIGHKFDMEFSGRFEKALLPSMEQELRSYFVMNIIGKWFVFTNKEGVEGYMTAAAGLLNGLRAKACFKQRPQRPEFSKNKEA